jgi:tetratricopeptide (TPR) repeat protein
MWKNRLEWWKKDFSQVQVGKVNSFKPVTPRSTRGNGMEMEEDSFSSAPMTESVAPSRSMDSAAIPQESFREESKSMSSMRKKSDSETSGSRPVNPGVAIKAWKPDAEYTKKISEAKDMFAEYLRQKQEFGNAPSFYLDCSDLFINAQQKDVGIQVLSNLAELELENPALLRILAHRLSQHEELEASSIIFSEVLEMRKEEPQSYRDLALVLGRMGRFVKAIELLYEVVQKTWDSRFPEIEVIALEEMNNLIVKAKAAGQTSFGVDERLIEPIDVDLRIVMTWDADMTDMDLWVMEPTGEKAFYSNPRTAIGGLVSRDFTRGYGPEEYMIRKAKTGTYEIKTNFYGSTSQKIAGAVTLQVDIFTNYGRPEEKRRSVTLRLKDKKETFTVADVEF